ncbi:hypothetical protein V8C86DRAFT_3152476 [Haematococcus lacustris]
MLAVQPYFETNATPSSVASTRSPSTSHDFASLEIVIKKASKRRPSPPNPARPDAPTQHLPSNGRKQRCSIGPTPSPSKGLYVNVQRMPRTEPSLSIAPLATPPVSATRAAATAGSHFACPAMFSSPKPEALPMQLQAFCSAPTGWSQLLPCEAPHQSGLPSPPPQHTHFSVQLARLPAPPGVYACTFHISACAHSQRCGYCAL